MSNLTRLLDAAAAGDRRAAAELLPLVYDELRKLAAARMADEKPGQTIQATALVHDAYLRLVGDQQFTGCEHVFAGTGETMRRILVDAARRKATGRLGGGCRRVELDGLPAAAPPDDLLDLDDALNRLAAHDPVEVEVVKLRFFAGLTVPEVAAALGVSVATAERHWAFARTWLFAELNVGEENPPGA